MSTKDRIVEYATTQDAIACWHGGQHDDARWFSTDEDHAWAFGDARRYVVSGTAVHVHASDITSASGYDADADAYAYLAACGADMLVIDGWEGDGLCILVSRLADVVQS